jgi:heme o synthase
VKLRAYYDALKPSRTYATGRTAGAGFLFAYSNWPVTWTARLSLFVSTLLGTTLVIMSACAVNNCTDRGIDARMDRTKKRATVTGEISVRKLATVGVVLGVVGFALLLVRVNLLTALIGAAAYVDYVVLYGWTKRHSVHSTVVGTICGAASLVAGYTAVTNRFDVPALLLGLMMVFWQMPHFYAIAIFRRNDYAAADLPVWTVRYGVRSAQVWIVVYTVLYILAGAALGIWGHAGVIATAAIVLTGLYWLYKGMAGLRAVDPDKWAHRMFGLSFVTLLVLCAALALAPFLQ